MEAEIPKKSRASFEIRRWSIFALIAITEVVVSFIRTCPNVLGEFMAKDYNVPKADFATFAAMFFYPYGIMQPVTGLLSDIVEPGYLIAGAHVLAAIGSVITGASNTFAVGCVGRFIVGLGTSPTYVPCCRCSANWFPLKYLPHMIGLMIGIGGVGGIISAGPLNTITLKYGWRPSYYGIAIFEFVLSIVCFFVIKGNPVTVGYPPVTPELDVSTDPVPLKEKLVQLGKNFKVVVSNLKFWIICCACVTANGPWFTLASVWASPYLRDIMQYSSQSAADVVIALSIGLIIGSFVVPPFSNLVKSRKWTLIALSVMASVFYLVFFLEMNKLSYGVIYFLYVMIGITTNPMTTVAYPFVSEIYHPSVAGTAVGGANFFSFLASALYQELSKPLIRNHGAIVNANGDTQYTYVGYRDGLWLFSLISSIVSIVFLLFTRDKKEEPKEEQVGNADSDNNVSSEGEDPIVVVVEKTDSSNPAAVEPVEPEETV